MRILIVNLHSARNLGDDAIMHETLSGLQDIFPSAQITLAATDPDSWRKYCNAQIEVVGSVTSWVVTLKAGYWRPRWLAGIFYLPLFILSLFIYRLLKVRLVFGSQEHRRLLSAYFDADLVLGCGGGNLYAHVRISPFFLMALISLWGAILASKKVVLLPQSVGPIQGRIQRGLAAFILNRVDKIMVREPRSMEFLQELRIKTPIVLAPDLALASPVAKDPPPVVAESDGLRIGVTVIDRAAQTRGKIFSPAQQEAYEATLASALHIVSKKYGATIYLFSQCNGPDFAHDDRRALHRVFLRLANDGVKVVLPTPPEDFLTLKAYYACMDCIVGSRMHTAIFAFTLGIPVILIGYQPKAAGMMDYFGLSRFCYEIERLSCDQLISGLSELIERREELKQIILRRYTATCHSLYQWRREIKQYA